MYKAEICVLVFCLIYFPILMWKGVIPAWKNINSDFPNYYTASKLLVQGKSLDSVYNDNWFQQKISDNGFTECGKFSPFPPATIIVFTPLVFFSPITAKRIFTVFNLLLVFLLPLLIKKVCNLRYSYGLALLFLSGTALLNNFKLGQVYLLMTSSLFLGFYLLKKNKNGIGSFFLSFIISVKYFPLIFIPALLIIKKYRFLLWMVVGVVLIHLFVFIIAGSGIYKGFYDGVFANHLSGTLSHQNPFAFAFQSWNSLLRNLFVYDAALNPHPVFASVIAFKMARIIIYTLLTASALFTFYKLYKTKADEKLLLGISGIFLFAISPASASYHLLLMLFPLAIILGYLKQKVAVFYLILLVMFFAATGFCQLLFPFDSANLFLAFMRLWAVTALYIYLLWLLHARVIPQLTKDAAAA